MLFNKNIIIIALPAWEGNYMKSTVELTKEFSKFNKVLYVDYQRTWKDLIFNFKFVPWKKMLGISNRLIHDTHTWVLTPPPIFPINWIKNKSIYDVALKLNSFILKYSIKNAIKKLNFNNHIVINAFNPTYGLTLLKRLNQSLDVYYCYDEISAADWCKVHGAEAEKEFMINVDAVICSSINLYNTKQKYNPNTFLIKNGVNFNLFNKYTNFNKFDDSHSVNIGYIGSLDNRLDYKLLTFLIKNIKEAHFTFIGRIIDPAAYQLEKYSNVTLLGSMQPDELAKETNKLDAGLIPFIKNEFTKNIYPLKINEYFAAGLPVVATDFANLTDFENDISIATNHKDFLVKLKRDIIKNNSVKALHRITIAKENSWTNRASQFLTTLDSVKTI